MKPFSLLLSRLHVRNQRLLLTGSAGVAQRMGQVVASLVILPVTLHTLGLPGFGVWGAATSLSWAGGMLDLGLGGALVSLLPAMRDEPERLRDTVAACLLTGVSFAVLLITGTIVVLAINPYLMPAPAFVVAGICLYLNIPLGLAFALWLGMQKGHVSSLWDGISTLLMVILVLVGMLLRAGPALMTLAIIGPPVLTNAGSMMHALICHPELRPQRWPDFFALWAPLRHGVLLALLSISSAMTYVFDNVLTLHWLGAVAAAQMALAIRICFTANSLLIAATGGIWPEFVEANAKRDHIWARRTLLRGTTITLGLALGGSALICLGGNQLLSFWLRENIALPSSLFVAITCWIVAQALPRVSGLLLTAMHRYKSQLFLVVIATIFSLIAKYRLAQVFGTSGVLNATAIAWGVFVTPCFMLLALRATRVLPPPA